MRAPPLTPEQIASVLAAIKRDPRLLERLAAMAPARLTDEDADLIAERVAERLGHQRRGWMTTAEAAVYLALPSANALHKLSSKGAIPFSQDVPNGKLYFRVEDLDAWRERRMDRA